jgi:uncharacterized protein (DUF3084 family)
MSQKRELAQLGSLIEQNTKELKSLESELQILQYERQTTEKTIEVRRRVRMQELDDKIRPLVEEREQLELNRSLLLNNLKILQDVKEQNENEKMMIEEDLSGSG